MSETTDLPIFVQNYPLPIGVPMAPDFLAQMACEIAQVCYIKEEIPPVTHTGSADLAACGDTVEGYLGVPPGSL